MKRSKAQKAGGCLMVIGAILLFAAALMLGYNLWDDHRAGESVSGILSQFPVSAPSEQSGDVEKSAVAQVPLYVSNPDIEMPTVEIDGRSYIGRIDIPVLSLSLPVMSEWNYSNLMLAPCRYYGSVYQENLVIAGHNYRSHFGSLQNLGIGDEVLFTDAEGNVFTYKVAEIETLAATDVQEMERGDWALTLFTCNLDGKCRVTVRCVAV